MLYKINIVYFVLFRIVRYKTDHVYVEIYMYKEFTTSAVLRRTTVSNTLLNFTPNRLHILAVTSCKLASWILEQLPMPKS